MQGKNTGILLVVLLSLSNYAQAAGPACFEIFKIQEPAPAITVREDFVHETTYTVDLSRNAEIRNQCSLPLCHLYSWSSQLENPKNIPISTEYLNVVYMFRTAMNALRNGAISGRGAFSNNLGATPIWSHMNIAMSGLIPKSAWKGRTDFMKEPTASRLTNAISNIIANAVVTRKNEPDNAMRERINSEALAQIDALMGQVIGASLPHKFEYQGKEYTPQTFAREFYPELYDPLVRITANELPTANKPTGTASNGVIDVSVNIGFMEAIAKAVLDSGRTVQLGYMHTAQFVDAKTGIMSIDAFAYPWLAAPPSRWMRSQNFLWSGMHAVELVGYEVNTSGQIVRWKIRNSWGTNSGDHGYYHMYADYFREFAYQIAYSHDGKTPVPGFIPEPVQLELFQ